MKSESNVYPFRHRMWKLRQLSYFINRIFQDNRIDLRKQSADKRQCQSPENHPFVGFYETFQLIEDVNKIGGFLKRFFHISKLGNIGV